MSIAINKKVKFDGARCPFSTFLRLQGDHHCACAQKWRHFSFFSKSFQTKKIKALGPKMTKIASRGSCLKTCDPSFFAFPGVFSQMFFFQKSLDLSKDVESIGLILVKSEILWKNSTPSSWSRVTRDQK